MIIGRTNFNDEKTNPDQKLNKERYFFISHLSRSCLIKSKITGLPVSLNKIIKFYGWRVISYSILKNKNIEIFNEIMINNLGFTEKTNNNKYIIFYDDQKPITTQRFTIAHEIGHILLYHFNCPRSSREKEANMFAARILMPMCLLYECKVENSQEVMTLFNVSSLSAEFRYKRYNLVRKRNKFYTDQNEKKLAQQLKNFIDYYLNNKKNKKD